MPEAQGTGDPERESVHAAAAELVPVLQRLDRPDLAARVTAASARLRRPSTIVCVVGEFKQGKSSLVNGLLGTDVCPVDDDLATAAITLVRGGDSTSAIVRRRQGQEVVAEEVRIEQLDQFVSEWGNPGNYKRVERVDITVDSPVLRQGLALVDTPGMGGLGAGHAAATMAFLPFADGLVLVTDASAELSAPEVAFLRQARELCPTVLVAVTKTDLYPEWRRIVELDKEHLTNAGAGDLSIISVSCHLRREALARRDRELNDRSGFPEILAALGDRVIAPARASAVSRSAGDMVGVSTLVRGAVTQELELIADPSRLDGALADLEEAKARLDHLRGPGARWSVLVGDRMADLSNDVTFKFRSRMRSISRTIDERIESLTKADAWDETSRLLLTEVAETVTECFVALADGRRQTREEVVNLLRDETPTLVTPGRPSVIDVSRFWEAKPITEKGSVAGKAFRTGFGGLRGAQSGVMMFGMVGQFLPSAAAALLATNPVLVGAGALFGGVQLLDDRKRKVQMRRQAARTQTRQFVDDVQFEVGNEIANEVRNIQRELRDEFTERLTELLRTSTDLAQQAQENAQRTDAESKQHAQELAGFVQILDRVEQRLGELTAA